MGFTENWYPPEQLRDLCGLLGSVLGDGVPGSFIEIGCWEGRSTVHLARTLGRERMLWAVDTWEGNVGEGPNHPTVKALRERDVFDTFVENLAQAGVADEVFVVRKDGRKFLRENHLITHIAFLHIDADHTYDCTKALIELALPLMSPGGVICGDDYVNSEGVRKAVLEAFPDGDATSWARGNLWWSRR